MSTRRIRSFLIIMVVSVVLPQYARAGDPPNNPAFDCKCKEYELGEGPEHNFNANGTIERKCNYITPQHDYPCHIDTLPGRCTVHVACEDEPPQFTSVLDLAGRRGATYNEARQSIQLVGCSGVVSVNMPVPSALVVAVREIMAVRYV